ncbi:MAG: M56 family metallopeptidase, partial [bacterium]
MEAMENFLAGPFVHQFGWILVHFIWQGLAVAFLLAVLLQILRRRSANCCYIVACCAMLLMAALPLVTLVKGLAPTARQALQTAQRPADVYEKPVDLESTTSAGSTTTPPAEQDLSQQIPGPLPAPKSRLFVRYDIPTLIEPYLPATVLLWLLGVFTLSVWRMGGWVELQRFKRRHVKPLCDEWKERIEFLVWKVGVSRPVRVVESAIVQIPSTIGWLKPVILVPTSALTGLPPKQLEAIIAHELAHIRRYDYLINLMQTAVETLFFYHPAVWWVSRRIRIEREHCCDEIAVAVCGDAYSYASALTKLEEFRHTSAQLAMAADGGHLSNRIRHVLNIRSPRSSQSNAWAAGPVGIAITALLCFLTLAQAMPVDSTFPLRGPGGELVLGHGRLQRVAFSPDGEHFLTGGLAGMFLHDAATGEIVRTFMFSQSEWLSSLSFSADGERILVVKELTSAWGCIGPASVWDVATGERISRIEPVASAAISPDGRQVAAVSQVGHLRLCNAETGEIIREIQLQKGICWRNCITFSPEGDQVFLATSEGTIVWDPATGGVLWVYEEAVGGPIAVSNDGTQFVTGGTHGPNETEWVAALWDVETGDRVQTL